MGVAGRSVTLLVASIQNENFVVISAFAWAWEELGVGGWLSGIERLHQIVHVDSKQQFTTPFINRSHVGLLTATSSHTSLSDGLRRL